MPSLRRTVSDSANPPRASPYPSSLSLSAASAINPGFPIRPPRRVASETCRRRVLADIEWWRILDGQQEENDSGNAEGNENVQDRAAADTHQGGALAEAMQETSVAAAVTTLDAATVMDPVEEDGGAAVASPDASQGASSLTTPFANLSISPPITIPVPPAMSTTTAAAVATPPMTPPRSRRNASESPASSTASTPQSSPRTPEHHHHHHQQRREKRFMDTFGFDFEDCGVGADADLEFRASTLLPPFLTIRGTKGLRNLGMMRSASLDGGFFDARRESSDERFGDLIFL